MADPKRPGTATPPPTLGEGCTHRYDIDALSDEDGTEFPGAAELWRALQDAEAAAAPPAKTPG
ncbi:hypothetical protein [Pseudomonas panipatensis]|uniref:hypothetical protein n=1 Tax=Pseudomonas panipatensis TaxID=428992 RepID=UPI0035AE955A